MIDKLMTWLIMFEVPLSAVALSIIVYVGVLLWFHRRMGIYIETALAIPALCLAILYVILDVFKVDAVIRTPVARLAFIAMMLWHTFILWYTRKFHD